MESNALLKPTDLLSHRLLGDVMPFGTGWCDDGEGKPVPWTVSLANLIYLAQLPPGAPAPKVYAH